MLEWIVCHASRQILNWDDLARQLHLHALSWAHLMLVVLNKRRFHHVNSMLSLNLLAIVQKELLVASQLLLDWFHRHFVDCLANLECSQCLQKLLCYIKHVLWEKCPFGLRVDKCLLGVLFFLLDDHVMALHEHQFLLQLFSFSSRASTQVSSLVCSAKLFLFVVCVPMEQFRRCIFRHVEL